MTNNLNPHVSIDCVIFGFHDRRLKILLIERETIAGNGMNGHNLKLPGSLISESEDLDTSANRILKELTGVNEIYLKQFSVFGSPDRLNPPEDLEWLRRTTGLKIDRVVTIAYYALITISESFMTDKTIWKAVNDLPELIFDHNQIIKTALESIQREIRSEALCFELLPEKFTLRQMQDVYEAILGEQFDNRNFRKKIRPLEFLIPLPEKEKNVSHKPAQLYRFDAKLYQKHRTILNGFNL